MKDLSKETDVKSAWDIIHGDCLQVMKKMGGDV